MDAVFEELDQSENSNSQAGEVETDSDTDETAGTAAVADEGEGGDETEGGESEGRGPEIVDQDAIDFVAELADNGITRDTINQTLTQARAFDRFTYLLENDPQEFLKTLKRSSPQAFEGLRDAATDDYLNQYGGKPGRKPDAATPAKATGNSRGANSNNAQNPEIAQLKEQVQQLTQMLTGNQQRQQYENLRTQYNTRVDTLVGKLELPTRDAKAVKALVNQSIANDPQALARINQGILIDVPRHLQRVLADWTADTKGEADNAKAQREAVQERGKREAAPGAQAQGTSVQPADSWEAAEQAFADALTKQRKK